MTDAAEIRKVMGTVSSVAQQTIRDIEMTQAVVMTDDGPITCMWRTATMPQAATQNVQYVFSGHIRDIKGRQVMIEPSFALRQAAAAKPSTAAKFSPAAKFAPTGFMGKTTTANKPASKPDASSMASSKGKFVANLKSLTFKQKILLAIIVVVIIAAVAVPVGIAKSHKAKPVQAVKKTEVLPPAYDANGKLIPNTPDDCDLATVPFYSVNKNDPTLPLGQTQIKIAGVNGQDKLCYIHGRGQFPLTNHIKQPVTQVVLVGTKK